MKKAVSKTSKVKILSIFMAILTLLSCIPSVSFAATVKNPWVGGTTNDNVFLDALEYLGYNTTQFTSNGKYGSGVSSSDRTDIGYNASGATGLETTNGKPDISAFKNNGLCCASYAAYVYFNYLPNVYGLDKSFLTRPSNPRSTTSWHTACEQWVANGTATKININASTNSSNISALNNVPIGSLLIFKNGSGYQHTAIYAGYKNGKHFQTNVGNSRGPEVQIIEGFQKDGYLTVETAYTPKYTEPLERGAVGVQKVDDTGKAVVGVKIGVYRDANCSQKIAEITTDDSGNSVYGIVDGVRVLEVGDTYYFKEISAPNGYDISSQVVSATVKKDTTTYAAVKIVDNRQGKITLTKVDDSGAVLGAGYVFGIYKDKDCTSQVSTMTTGADGKAVSEYLSAGTYYVKEKSLPESDNTHEINPTAYPVNVTFGDIVSVNGGNIINERQRGSLQLIKTSEDGVVAGLRFHITGNGIDEIITTSEDGTINKENLLPGEYTIAEVDTPSKYVQPQSQTVTVEANKTATVTFENVLKRGSLKILKESEDGLIEDIEFKLTGTSLSGENIVLTAKTDADGIAIFNNLLISGDTPYVLEEVNTGVQYVVPTKQNIKIEWNKVVETVVENKLIRGNVEGKKFDDDGFEVAGALIGLFKADETEFTEETALMTCETNPIGVFAFEDVAYGSYLVREIAAPEGFNLNDTVYPVVIEENKQIINVEIEDKFITGSVQTTKVDEQYPDNKLSGAVFEVYVDVNGNEEFDADIDKLVGEMTEAEKGVYRMEGLRFNGYFLHEKTAPEGFLADDGYYYFKISTEGETVIVENEAGVGFTNKPIVGILELTKTDVATGKPLPNAGFRIKDMDGNVVAEGYTDENGIAKFELRYGKYTYEEFDAPDGYQIDEKPYEFEITENGEIVKAAMTNTPIPVTGNNTPVWQYVTIIAVAFGCVIGGVVLLAKKKKKK